MDCSCWAGPLARFWRWSASYRSDSACGAVACSSSSLTGPCAPFEARRKCMSSTHRVSVDLLGNMAFRAITESGHEVVMDAAPEVGGTDTGPRPMELLLVGLGGCTGMDVISMLRKMRQDVTDYQIEISGERATEHPKVYT